MKIIDDFKNLNTPAKRRLKMVFVLGLFAGLLLGSIGATYAA